MPLDGKQRVLLREAVLSGFQSGQLKQVVGAQSKDWNRIVANAPYQEQVDDLITVAYSEGWLIDLCRELAREREDNPEVRDPISDVQTWLEEERVRYEAERTRHLDIKRAEHLRSQRSIVLSSVDPDAAWKVNFQEQFIKLMEPCHLIDTLDRMKQSKEAAPTLRRDIQNAQLFIALVSKRYIRFQQTVEEIEHALSTIDRAGTDVSRPRRLLAVLLDQEGANWFENRFRTLAPAGGGRPERVIIEKFFDHNGRRSIVSGGKVDDKVAELITELGEKVRSEFEQPVPVPFLAEPGPPIDGDEAADVDAASASDRVIVLGESKGVSDPAAAAAITALVENLSARPAIVEQWPDGWRLSRRTMDTLDGRPIFVRAVVDKTVTNADELASRLTSELKVSFDLDFDDESEKARPIHECPRVLWRPGGPDWTPPERGPLVFSSVDHPPELARWLIDRLGLPSTGNKAPMVRYEDPIEKKNPDRTVRRRQALEDTLLSLTSAADTVPVGHGHLLEVVNRIDGDALTIIAAHDLDTKIDDEQDTISRFQSLDRGIEQSLARARAEKDVPLLLVAALFRNAKLFPQFEFSRETRIRRWQLLRFFEGPDGSYRPDEENLDRLREQVAFLSRSNEQRVSS